MSRGVAYRPRGGAVRPSARAGPGLRAPNPDARARRQHSGRVGRPMPDDAPGLPIRGAGTHETLDYGRVQVLRLRIASTAPRARQLPPNTTGKVGLLPVRGRLVAPGGVVVTASWVSGDSTVVDVTIVLP